MTTRPATDGEVGVAFPPTEGGRSTSAAGKMVLSAAAAAVDGPLAAAIRAEPDWRRRYVGHVRALVEAEVRSQDPEVIPRAGLDAIHASFEFVREGGAVRLADACASPVVRALHTHEFRGTGDHAPLQVPYRGQMLEGELLRRQLDRWVAAGTVEPTFAFAIGRVLDHPDWLDCSDLTVVVLGAGAELGPVVALTRWGASLVLVDLPDPSLWGRLLADVAEGCGRVLVPTARPVAARAGHAEVADAAGVDLVRDVPELAVWLRSVDGPLVLGNYVYADGADHVRATLAADAVAVDLLQRRDDVTLAGLLTPTDVYAVPSEVVEHAERRCDNSGLIRRAVRIVSGGRAFVPNYTRTVTSYDGHAYGLADGLIPQQGPNYALAKRLQQWRFRRARHEGVTVSANVAPATRTRSVTKNRLLAAAYAGAHRFDVEVFAPATSRVLMAALLVYDLRSPEASGRPEVALGHPSELFVRGAAHGGLWRQPYSPRSVLPLAAIAGLPSAR